MNNNFPIEIVNDVKRYLLIQSCKVSR